MGMRYAGRQNTILLVLTFALRTCLTITPTTCVAPACDLGRTTTVTCYFHQDLWITKHEILVKHYPTSSNHSDPGEDVLFCYWISDFKKHHCIAEHGYQFIDNVSDHLVLTIPSVAKQNEGQYACHIIPPDNTVVHRCRLTVQEPEVLSSSTTHPSSDTTPEIDGNEGCQSSEDDSKLLALVALTVTAVATCIVVCFLYSKNIRYRRGYVGKANYGRSSGESCEPDSVMAMLGDEEGQLRHTTGTKSASSRMYCETAETGSQTDKSEVVDQSVVHLLQPDEKSHVNGIISTSGICLEMHGDDTQSRESDASSITEDNNTVYDSDQSSGKQFRIAGVRRRRYATSPLPSASEEAFGQTRAKTLLRTRLWSKQTGRARNRNTKHT